MSIGARMTAAPRPPVLRRGGVVARAPEHPGIVTIASPTHGIVPVGLPRPNLIPLGNPTGPGILNIRTPGPLAPPPISAAVRVVTNVPASARPLAAAQKLFEAGKR